MGVKVPDMGSEMEKDKKYSIAGIVVKSFEESTHTEAYPVSAWTVQLLYPLVYGIPPWYRYGMIAF